MATITAVNGSLLDVRSLVAANLTTGLSYSKSPTSYRIDYGAGDADLFTGTGFTYQSTSSYVPKAGTITAYTHYDSGVQQLSITGLKLSAVALYSAALTSATSDEQTLYASALAGNDVITGSSNTDYVRGYAGNDLLKGGAASDAVIGDAGQDTLVGGAGKDYLYGGAGSDVFDFEVAAESGPLSALADLIFDFKHLTDKIDLKTIDANTSKSGDQAFTFLATAGASFTGASGQLHWFQQNNAGTVNDVTVVEADINGDKTADFRVELTGLITLTASDFIL